MKKFSLFIFSLLCFLLVACKNDLFDKGSIRIQLPEINTEVKSSRAAVSYNFTLTFTNSKNETITENGVSGETLTLNLDADTYKIAGEVYNQDGVLYYAGETEAVVEIGVLTEVKLVLKKVYVEPETPEEELPEEIPEETPEEELPEEVPEETPEEELPEEKPEEILKTDLIYFSWGTPNFERINYYSSRDEKKVLLEKEQQGFISCMVVVIDDAPIEVAVLSGSETYTDMSKLEFIDVKENPDSGIEEANVEILEESIAMLEEALTAMGDVEDTPDILNIKQLVEDEKSVVNLVNTLTAAGEKVKLYAFRIEPANVKEVDGYTFVIKNYERLESDKSVVAKDTPIITDTYTFREINCYLMNGDVKMLSDNYEEKGFIYSSEMFGEKMLFGLNFESDDNNLGEFTHNLYYKDITDKGYKIYVNDSEYSKDKLEDIQTYIGSVPVVMATENGTVLVDDRVNVIPDFVKVGLAGTTSNEFDEDNMVYDEYCVSLLKVNTSDAKGKSLAVGLRNPDQIYNYCVEGGSKNYEALGLFDGLSYIWTITRLDGDAAEPMMFENRPVEMSSILKFSDLNIVLEMECIVEDDATPVTLFSNRMEFELRIIDDSVSTGGTGGAGSAGGTGSGSGMIDMGISSIQFNKINNDFSKTDDANDSRKYFESDMDYLNYVYFEIVNAGTPEVYTVNQILTDATLSSLVKVTICGTEYSEIEHLENWFGNLKIAVTSKENELLSASTDVNVYLHSMNFEIYPEISSGNVLTINVADLSTANIEVMYVTDSGDQEFYFYNAESTSKLGLDGSDFFSCMKISWSILDYSGYSQPDTEIESKALYSSFPLSSYAIDDLNNKKMIISIEKIEYSVKFASYLIYNDQLTFTLLFNN